MATRSKAGISPDLVSGLIGWFKADAITPVADGTALDTWSDSSVSADHLTGTTTTRPLYKTNIINGLPVVRFDGTDDKMTKISSAIAAALSGTDVPFSALAVVKKATNNTSDVICAAIAAGDGASAAMHTLQTSASDQWQSSRVDDTPTTSAPTSGTASNGTTPHLVSMVFTGTACTLHADGAATTIAATSQNVGATTLGTFRVGAGRNSGNPFDGDIGEILIYNRVITVNERQALEQYLAAKWGLSTPATARAAAATRTIATERTRAGTLPSSIAGLLAWFKADAITPVADGTALSTWADSSGHSEDVTAATTLRPLYKLAIINGLPVVRFDGTDDFMSKASSATAAALSGSDIPATIIAVLKKNTNNTADVLAAVIASADLSTSAQHLLQTGGAAAWHVSRVDDTNTSANGIASQTADTNPHIASCIFYGTTTSIFVDGAATSVALTALNVGAATFDILRLGASRANANDYNGDLGEVLIYGRALASWERLAVETYLSAKWGITVAGVTITRTAA